MQPLRIMVLAYRDPSVGVDRVVPRVVRALEANGHSVSVLTVSRDIQLMIDGLRAAQPDLIFNLLEQFGDREIGSDIGAVGLLDLLQIPYTGGGPGEFYLTGDKSLTKKILAFESIDFPNFAVFPKGAGFESRGSLRMPLFVKPLRLDASIGIDSGALVRNTTELMERVKQIHEQCDDDALVEEYIEGRELYVAVLGNEDQAVAFPPIEMDFSGLPEGAPKVMDAKAKFDTSSAEYRGTRPKIAELGDDLAARVKTIALDACRALRVRDYGRVDMRLDESGQLYVLEVNASCYLDDRGEFVMAANEAGIEYDEVIQRIVASAMTRCRFPGPALPPRDHFIDPQPRLRAASRVMSTEYYVACTARLPDRPWDESFGPVSIASLPREDDVRLQLQARLDGTDVTNVVVFSSRAAGHLAFQFATALAKIASGVVFDEESLDEPLADYRGYPAMTLSGGIEKVWQMTIESEARAVQLRARRDQDEWELVRRRDPRTEEEWS